MGEFIRSGKYFLSSSTEVTTGSSVPRITVSFSCRPA